ncbi:nitrate reductase [Aliiglaciecola sp. LCG003]|uniref:nitrate reductase n=1 Tax=Aliiglaciecola sp. LCG003 TaxID=3053655 RepID=UPI002573B636|nr:nitrate reductase [Aliiglaciecola sp. LCG003]WJG11101.1 nitrate reductase [Aliiglaciecola sp. LCG003]
MLSNKLVSKSSPSCVESTCPYCGVGCGVEIELGQTAIGGTSDLVEISAVRGMPSHPANYGKLCVKGSHLLETNGIDGRMLVPQVDGEDCSWEHATAKVASVISQSILQHGADSVAFYVSGQLLTEDYYVANKLMKGFIGSANIDTNSRLCMSSAVASYQRAFGADAVPCSYDDLELTDLLVFIGSNAAWTHPVLFQRIERARQKRPEMQIIFIDPRKTASCEIADLHLPIKPGSDVALFNGLLTYLHQHAAVDFEYINQHTENFTATLDAAADMSVQTVAAICEIEQSLILAFYRSFAKSNSAVSFYSMGVNQSSSGVDKGNAIINCHLASGKIGKPGSGPFSITGQPNAMGGREVGGLANMLAAHMELTNPEHREWVQQFWQSPHIPHQVGYKAVDMFDQVALGNIKVIWIMATNPVVSMPNRTKIEAALRKCENVIVSDCVNDNDTLRFANIRLPASGWSEKNGTVTNSERRISRQRGVLAPPGEAKHDWQIIIDVAHALGFGEHFNYLHPVDIFQEHARLSGHHNNGKRCFDISGMADISQKKYDQLKPIQWPVNQASPTGTKRLFTNNSFYTSNHKARFIAIKDKLPELQPNHEYPFMLNSGRLRDQWHSMTRTGKSTALLAHADQAKLQISQKDALELKLSNDQLVAVCSEINLEKPVVLPIQIVTGLGENQLFVPIHWGETWGSSCSVSRLFGDTVDPISGQPELKYSRVNLLNVTITEYCELISMNPIDSAKLQEYDYWSVKNVDDLFCYSICLFNGEFDLTALQALTDDEHRWLTFNQDDMRSAIGWQQQQISAALYVSKAAINIVHAAYSNIFKNPQKELLEVADILRNNMDASTVTGNKICSCFDVTQGQICEAIQSGLNSVEQLGKHLKCGTNCGSCKPELKQLIELYSIQATECAATNEELEVLHIEPSRIAIKEIK